MKSFLRFFIPLQFAFSVLAFVADPPTVRNWIIPALYVGGTVYVTLMYLDMCLAEMSENLRKDMGWKHPGE